MMKTLVWILLLGNLVFFAAMQWGVLPFGNEQPARAQPPLHEEKIGLLGAPPDKPVTEPATLPLAVEEYALASAPVGASAPLVPESDVSCLEWGEFSGADLERATAALSALQLGDKLGQRQVEYAIGYWVYIPPQKDKAAVNQKVAQLKARGIEEYFVVPEAGPWQNAISLGVFKTQEAAQHFLDDLQRNKDVRTAKIGERASKLKMTIFVLSGLDAGITAHLAELQKDFAGSELKEASCAH
jgi:hypothetical protein